MKKAAKYGLIVLAVAIAAGIIWWRLNKKAIVRHTIENAVAKGTDGAYYIHYDSSNIDEVGGNASFYNIVLQQDSLQRQLYTGDTSATARMIFNVHIEKLSVRGVNIPDFLQKNKAEAEVIEVIRPYITIINTGKGDDPKLSAADTLAIYEKLTGKFNSIKAGQIKITDGTVVFARGTNPPNTVLQGVNVDMQNLQIDSTHNYDKIISYFLKDVVATVKSINAKDEASNRMLRFEGVEYNAPARFLKVDEFLQTDVRSNKKLSALTGSRLAGLSTNAFIINHRLIADSFTIDKGSVGIYKGRKAKGANETIEIDNEFFEGAIVKNIRFANITTSIFNRENSNQEPLVLQNLQFNARDIDSIYNGIDVLTLIAKSNWHLSGAGFSFATKDNKYKISIGPFSLDNSNSIITVKNVAVIPVLSEAAFAKSLKFQKDRYDLRFNNIQLRGTDVKRLLAEGVIIAEQADLQPILNIFNDRTVTPDSVSKIGQYPQQLLQKMQTGIYIKTVKFDNGSVHYKEKGAVSKKTGVVAFDNINGTISNFTNIESYKKQNAVMTVTATATFLNMAAINSVWKLPLTSSNGTFSIAGKIGSFKAPLLNPVTEPLGMASIKSGKIHSYTFTMQGDDLKAEGEALLLYDDLKVSFLKRTDDGALKDKDLLSGITSIFMKDKNTAGDNARKGDMAFKRVTSKTFFNLVWKSLFAGAKSSVR